ncbi:MAG: DUF885 domain-containing protein [Deltaproteobacteria bacterium]|nr:DUF885 domain-containing protein [Deltaproteobacteria bacterium]
MRRASRPTVCLLAALLLCCGQAPAWARPGAVQAVNAVADAYTRALRRQTLRPTLSAQSFSAWLRALSHYEERLARVDPARLDAQGRITYRMLKADFASQREALTQGWTVRDLHGFVGVTGIVDALDELDRSSVAGWRRTLTVLARTSRYVDGFLELQNQALAAGTVGPKLAIRSALATLAPLVSRRADRNPFLALERELAESLAGRPELPALQAELRDLLRENVLPAHRRLATHLAKRVLPRGGKVGADREVYLRHMAAHLGPDHASPEELHAWGRTEVERLRGELWKVARTVEPSARSVEEALAKLRARRANHFGTADALLGAVKGEIAHARRVARKMAPLPKSRVEVAPVPSYMETTTAALYWLKPGPPSKLVGEMQINVGPLLGQQLRHELATLATHEVWGGHHLAAVVAMRQKGLPKYRREASFTAFDEGWALYAEQWRDEQGAFSPEERVGFLVGQLWRAARLVVDTGLHTGTLSPTAATAYFQRNAFTSRTAAKAEIERYVAEPAQALAYYVGKTQLLALREAVRKTLGRHYDERAFHAKLLSLGSVPLAEAREAMLEWAERRRCRPLPNGRPPC